MLECLSVASDVCVRGGSRSPLVTGDHDILPPPRGGVQPTGAELINTRTRTHAHTYEMTHLMITRAVMLASAAASGIVVAAGRGQRIETLG
jgi:hypothetical protein